MVTRGRGWGEGEMEEGGQKVKTSHCKTSKYKGCNVQHEKYDNAAVCYIWKLRVLITRKKILFSFSFILYLYEVMNIR